MAAVDVFGGVCCESSDAAGVKLAKRTSIRSGGPALDKVDVQPAIGFLLELPIEASMKK